MTKKQWDILKNKVDIPMSVWYEYYLERGGNLPMSEFESIFSNLLFSPPITAKGRRVSITLDSSIWNLYCYYDKKFEDEK